MKERTRLRLKGYFDYNFGDDYMMKIIIDSLPEVEFVIDEQEKLPRLLKECGNVTVTDTPDENLEVLYVTGSGFMINNNKALLYELVWLIKGKNRGDYCLGCNIEPLDTWLKKWLIVQRLNKFKLLVCRDTKSYKWLCSNVKKPVIKQLPDIVLSLEGLPEATGDKLGIAMMHRLGDEEDCAYYRAMAEIADHWVETTGREVILFAFDSGIEDDVFACDCVKKMMKHKERATYAVHRDGGEIIEGYTQCKKIIGARFHSIVLAIKMGIDVYPVAYREKVKNLIDDLTYPVKGCAIDSIDAEGMKAFLLHDVKYVYEKNKLDQSFKYAEYLKEAIGMNRG